jgi:hypothetical protein
MKKKDRKREGKYDYDGACKPGGTQTLGSQETFSVGVFKWLPKAGGKGLKRSPVIYRVKGRMSQPEKVYDRAEELCDWLDGQVWRPTKRRCETVKPDEDVSNYQMQIARMLN